jgi:hypothetical protein
VRTPPGEQGNLPEGNPGTSGVRTNVKGARIHWARIYWYVYTGSALANLTEMTDVYTSAKLRSNNREAQERREIK